MAKRIGNRREQAAKAAALARESDLAVLHPERDCELSIDGALRKVTVREYGHVEWLKLLPRAEPLVAAIAAALAGNEAPTYEQALAVYADHADAMLPLVAQAADLTLDQVQALGIDDGELLFMTWWGVNGGFFVRRARNRVLVERAAARGLAGAGSTPGSSTSAST